MAVPLSRGPWTFVTITAPPEAPEEGPIGIDAEFEDQATQRKEWVDGMDAIPLHIQQRTIGRAGLTVSL